jgi:hypothetical protein
MLYSGANILKNLGDDDSIAVGGAVIKVTDLNTSLIPLFTDKAGTITLTNPFVADASGQFRFYCAPGEYDLTATKNAVSSNMLIEVGLSGQVETVEIETNALTITSDDHGILYDISDLTGSVAITIDAVPAESVGIIVFAQSNTVSPISILAGAGVTLRSAYLLEVYAKDSIVAFINVSELVWSVVGDLKQ